MKALPRSLARLALALVVSVAAGCGGGRSELPVGIEAGGSGAAGPVDACAFADGSACDDGDPCTSSDTCSQGSCHGQGGLCPVEGSASQISVGQSHACAVTKDGEAWCWGYNQYGQLGDGTHVDSAVPVRVAGLSPGVNSIAVGYRHTCAITQDFEIKCWGFNGSGQLGNDGNLDSSLPVNVRGLSDLDAWRVSAGTDHTCAIVERGRGFCWGRNNTGQLGNDFSSEALAAYEVQDLEWPVMMVFAGQQFTCVITILGQVECFGSGGRGQLGQGRTADSKLPVHVEGLGSPTEVVATGEAHACAITRGVVECWGDNSYGQLGANASRDGSTAPVEVPGLGAAVTAVAAGTGQTCAITSAGGVKCWGDGDHGQLGNGSTAPSAKPVAVTGLDSGVVAISAGTLHACAVTAAGHVYCWGYNPYGSLGNGSTKDSFVPVRVRGF